MEKHDGISRDYLASLVRRIMELPPDKKRKVKAVKLEREDATEVVVLRWLEDNGPAHVMEVVKGTRISFKTVQKTLANLHAAGKVSRSKAKKNRRWEAA